MRGARPSRGSRSLYDRSKDDERYNRSEKGRARYRRYRETEKGRANERRVHLAHNVKRRQARIQTIEKELTHSRLP